MGKGIVASVLWGGLVSLGVPVLLPAEDGHFRAAPTALERQVIQRAEGLMSGALDLLTGTASLGHRLGLPNR